MVMIEAVSIHETNTKLKRKAELVARFYPERAAQDLQGYW